MLDQSKWVEWDKNALSKKSGTTSPRVSLLIVLMMLTNASPSFSLMIIPYRVPGRRTSWCCGESGLSTAQECDTRANSFLSMKLPVKSSDYDARVDRQVDLQ